MLPLKVLSIFVVFYLKIPNISCEGATLAFAIDDTRTMGKFMDEIKNFAKNIVYTMLTENSREIKDFLLITINDPDVVLRSKTSFPRIFLHNINEIHVHNSAENNECEEMSLTGTEKALEISEPGSLIFVFTDANAKDYGKVNLVKNLCQKKNSQVVFVLTGDCGHPSDRRYTVYYEIAAACSGQVFRVRGNQIDSVENPIKVFLERKHSLVKWTMRTKSYIYFKVPFSINETTDYALISVSGKNAKLRLTSIQNVYGREHKAEIIMRNDYGMVVKISSLLPGTYYAYIKGNSVTSLMIYVPTPTKFTFDYEFSALDHNSMEDTSKQPTGGKRHRLFINVNDPNNLINIRSVQILDVEGGVVKEMPLRKTDNSLYVTDAFVSPIHMFKIKIIGEIKKTRQAIETISNNIEPSIDVISNAVPEVDIDEGVKLDVDYGGRVSLTCKVNAHPPPTIEWLTAGGIKLQSEIFVIEEPQYISYLKLNYIKKQETFVCRATNTEGTGNKQTVVIVRPIFNAEAVPEAKTTAKYGEDLKIQCNIKSYLPIVIKWFRSGGELRNNDEHSISTDGSVLTLKSMDLGKEGKYTCVASLNSDPTVKQTHGTEVIIPGLAPPVIGATNRKIYVQKTENEVELNCKTVIGYPKSHVQWFKKNGNEFHLLSYETRDVLTVPRASFAPSAQYKCVAENVMGSDSAEFVIIPESKPDVNIDEGINLHVSYGVEVSLTCKVTAYPPPITIEWFTIGGVSLPSETFSFEETSYISHLKLQHIKKNETYVCKATNTEGTKTMQTEVYVRPVYDVLAIPAVKTFAKYGEDVKIQCNIKSSEPIQIKWYWFERELTNTNEHFISADGSELTLNSLDIGRQGKYTCEASLKSDPSEKQSYETYVKIPGLAPPAIKFTNYKISLKKRDNEAELNCETVRGYPKPHVQWYKKNGNKFELLSNETREVLTVPRASITSAGQYKCVTENDMGTDSADFVVILESEPDVKIDEGAHMYVDYGAAVFLTCRVNAHPPPTIRWFTLGGIPLPFETTVIEEPLYISYLNLRNIRKNETYVCKSTNTEGTRMEQIQVDVRTVFNVVTVPPANTTTKYGEIVKIQCKINSYLPMKIKWFRSGSELSNTDMHSISADGSELTLKYMNLRMQGKYICEASLNSNPNEKQIYETTLTIPGLARPVIESKNNKIFIKNGDKQVELNCQDVIGYPKPHVQWYKKNGDKFKPLPHGTSEVLKVPRTSITRSGQYKCVTENLMGSDSAEFVVIPESEPVVNIDEGNDLNVDYGAEITLTCKVTAYPPPSIGWFTIDGTPLPSETTFLEETSYTGSLKLKNIKKNVTYVCQAANTEGPTIKQIHVNVRRVFIDYFVTPKADIIAKYGEDKKIQCNISSYLPINIKWFHSGRQISNTNVHSISADGSELTLKSMDFGMEGNYTCEASLNSDPTQKQIYETTVVIPGLELPSIGTSDRKVYVMKIKNETELNCRIVRGYPKPHVQWFKKNGNEFELLPYGTSEVLTVSIDFFTHVGKYRCIAENVMGSDSADFVVIMESEPDVKIGEGVKLNVDYGAGVSLTCKVTAHPHPKIEWLTPGGISMPSETTALEEPSYISHLELSNIKNNETYICKATNTEGTSTDQIKVDVKPVFTEIAVPAATTNAKYGEDIKIQCEIKSYLPINVKWSRSGSKLSNTTAHSISADGLELTLKSMDLGMQGKYACEASVNSEPTVAQTHETNVTIPGLALPVIESKHRKMYIKKGEEAEISCKTVIGYPKSHVQWFKKNGNEFDLLSYETRDVLIVPRASFAPSAQYKCVAENVMGSDSAEFVVIPEGQPDVTIDEGVNLYIENGAEVYLTCKVYAHPSLTLTCLVIMESEPDVKIGEGVKLNVDYGAGVSLTCKVTAHPHPKIEWLTAGGISMPSETTALEEPSYISHLELSNIKNNETYICKATNTEGTSTDQIKVDVKPVFTEIAVPAATTNAKYGEDIKIQCEIKSYLPINVKWSRSGSKLSNTTAHSISADGLELTLKSMDLGMQGKYACEASVNSEPTVAQTHETNVTIPGLALPVIESKHRKMYIKKGEEAEISCKTVIGYPKSHVQWFKKNGNEFDLLSYETRDVLIVPRASFAPSAQYKCVAENVMGSDSAEFVVIPEGQPDVTIDEGVNLYIENGAEVYLTCKVYAHPSLTLTCLVIMESEPDVKIGEGVKLNVDYGAGVSLTCKVTAHPHPKIEWLTAGGISMPSETTALEEPSYISHLELSNIKNNETYICKATNTEGTSTDQIKVDVKPVFTEIAVPAATTNAKYGEDIKIQCEIKSYLPINVKWSRSGSKLSNTTAHSISADGLELTLKSMDLGMQGKYACEASVNSEPTVAQTHETNVTIPGLALPVIESKHRKMYIKKGEEAEISCKTVIGYPKSHVQWFKKNGNEFDLLSYETRDVLIVPRASFAPSAQYKCVAENVMGSDSAEFVVIMESEPDVKIGEGVRLNVDYGAGVSLTCKVTAHPHPKIEWLTAGGISMPSETTALEEPSYISHLELSNIKKNETYICKATNTEGTRTNQIQVDIKPVFTEIAVPAATTNAKYGEDIKIQCEIKSYLPINVKWSRSGSELSNTTAHSISADGLELTLKSMDLGMQGKYACEASVNSEPTVAQTHETNVTIPGLALPVIESKHRKMYIKKGEEAEISCKTVIGYPKSHVQWFKKNGNEFDLLSYETRDVLIVPRASFASSGQYKCVAENVMGSDSAEFVVIPEGQPDVTIDEGVNLYIEYGAEVYLTCKVYAHPPPTMEWFTAGGISLSSESTLIEEPSYVSRLKMQNVKKNETVICQAKNAEGTRTNEIHINVRPVFNATIVPAANTAAKYSDDVKIQCGIKSYLPIKIKWFRSGSELSNNDEHSISADGSELTLKSVDLGMEGKYTCKASLISDPTENQTHETEVKIVGLVHPEITHYSTVVNGTNFTAICRVDGAPKPTVSWQFKPHGSEEFTTLPGSKEELNIPELRLRDSGFYRCIVTNLLSQTWQDFKVIVEERPTVTNEVNNYVRVDGDLRLRIPCNVSGISDPTIVWKEGGKTIENDSKYVVEGNVLDIKNPVISDTYNFTCEVTNKLGTKRAIFYTEVKDNFENVDNLYGDTHDVYVEQGKPITITCNITNADTNSVRWYLNGQKKNHTGREYFIDRATVKHDGNYTCCMNTHYGSKSESFILDVGMAPVFEDGPSLTTIDWHDVDTILDCTAFSKPTEKIEWLHNGKKVESLNDLSIIPVADWGEYTCIASNIHGSTRRTFKIITSGCHVRKSTPSQNIPLLSDLHTPTWPLSMSNINIVLKEHEEIKLSCPNNTISSNAFEIFPNKTEIIAQCQTEDTFTVDGKLYKYKDLHCKRTVEASVLNTNEECSGPQSEIIRVGFAVNGFLEAFSVCYDRSKNVPLYASAPISLSQSGNEVDTSAFNWRLAPGLGDRPTGGFTCGTSRNCCYAKGQLLNATELAFGPAQDASFIENLNSVAVWNPCSESNRTTWQDFEMELKSMSSSFKIWFSWTGASDYVKKNGGFVPRYLWKVMYYDDYFSVMVYVNDESPVADDIRCTELCETMLEAADKFLYCCSLDEFSEVFGIPSHSFKDRINNATLKPEKYIKNTLIVPIEV